MKSNVKKFASVLLAAVMLFSMCAIFSVSAAEAPDAVGAGLNVTGQSNYCTAPAAVTVSQGSLANVTFTAPAALNVVGMQWTLDYDKTKLQLMGTTAFSNSMVMNLNAVSHSALGSFSDDANPVAIAQGGNVMTFKFRALTEGAANVIFNVVDLMVRTDAGDKITVNNSVIKDAGASFTVNAASNFFSAQSRTFEDVTQYEDANGDMYVTVEYKVCAEDLYIINIDLDELTYDPAVLEWSESYNTFGTGRSAVVDLFPFAAENGYGAGTYHKVADGRLVGNFSAIKPAAYASEENGDPITAVKATFKVLNLNAGSTTVNCKVDTISYCDITEKNPYMKYVAISNKTVDAANKAKATYSTAISAVEPSDVELLLGDVDKDGSVTINDATMLQRYLSEFISSVDSRVADVTKDGKVNVKDVTEIQRFVAGLRQSF